jgi:predicted O-linked N-acetylglucosamine transferase (SPINDLY family)
MPDAEVAKRIRAHEIDILIDLHGLSSGARPEIFTQRPAPIQMTWLGYIGTTTFPWIDYVIADEHSIPQELESLFSEKVIRLQGSFLPGRPAPTNPVQSSTKVGPSDQAVIGCLNNIYKIKPDMLRVWGKILLEHPNVELLLLDDNATATENIKAFLLNMGVPEDRIRFYKRGPYAEYKQVMKSLTVYLDTYPYNAGSTARDVIDAGVPMVTLSGRTFVSRMCGGVLKSFGMAECVTTSYSQYKSKVIDYLKGDCKVPVDDAGGSSVTCAESCASLEAEIQALYNSATQLV